MIKVIICLISNKEEEKKEEVIKVVVLDIDIDYYDIIKIEQVFIVVSNLKVVDLDKVFGKHFN